MTSEDHICKAFTRATGTLVLEGSNGAIVSSEYKLDSQSPETFECTCGREFDTQREAEEHLVEATLSECDERSDG